MIRAIPQGEVRHPAISLGSGVSYIMCIEGRRY